MTDEWAGFEEVRPRRRARGRRDAEPVQPPATVEGRELRATGRVHDGDTFAIEGGGNARLYGADAFELGQTGTSRTGELIQLGNEARGKFAAFAQPGAVITATGGRTYGRPVASVDNGGDAAQALLAQGLAITTPEYLRADPERLGTYMEAERDARVNRRGAWSTQFDQPASYRHGTADPWAKPVAGREGESEAVFWDEPLPFQGLRPEVADGYQAIWQDRSSKPADLMAYAKANGFSIDAATTRKAYAERDKGRKAGTNLTYDTPPRVLTDPGDGAFGSFARGLGDPLNVIDEAGALVDTLGGTGGRESLLNSDRRFGDIYSNNLDQNRSILAHDDATNPYWRLGGQLASGLAIPGASVEGVGLAAARTALRDGGTRMVAEAAGRAAVRNRLIAAGTLEGAAIGAGGGETLGERAAGAVTGGITGGVLGLGAGTLGVRAVEAGQRALAGRGGRTATRAAAGADDTVPPVARDAGAPVEPVAATQSVPASRVIDPALDPLVTSPAPTPRDLPTNSDRTRLTDYTPTLWREMSFDGDGFGRLTMPSELAGRWRNEGGTDLLQFADTPALATGQGRNKGILFEYDAAPFVGKPQLGKPGAPLAWGNGAGEYSTNGVTQEMLQGALRGFKVKHVAVEAMTQADRAVFGRITGDLEQRGWTRVDAEDGSTIYRRPAGDGDTAAPRMAGDDPLRAVDRIDVNARPRPILDPATATERAAQAERVQPGDMLPLPSNAVGSMEEAEAIAAGRVVPVRAPDERAELERRTVTSATTGTPLPKRGPLDLVTWLRANGGIRARGGELERYGIGNTPRQGMDFAGGENRFGPLVANEGMTYDDAAEAAWEAGFFPDRAERPTVSEFLDALSATHSGRSRAFRSDDLDEVERFEAARGQRYAVEAAEQERRPLVADRGQAIGPDDLDANTPPVSAYEEWGENAPRLVGNLRLDKLDSPQAIGRALASTHAKVGGFDAATRGRITQAETERLAGELGMTADDLLARRKGQAFNAEEALAARQILARSATDLVNLSRRIQKVDNPGEELEAAFKQSWLRHVAIQEQVAGATAEAGRALSAFRMAADARAANRVLPALGDIAGGTTRIRDVADAIVDLEANGAGAGAVNAFAARALKPRWQDKAVELYLNFLLSGPQTHAVNILSNTLTALGQIPEHMVAAGVGAARKALPSQRETDRVLFSEAGTRMAGLIAGTREGLRIAARSVLTGETSDAVTKLEQQSQEAIGGIAGSIIRTPSRALAAEDELFKAMARRMELNGSALRRAHSEGLKGADARARAREMVANPPDALLARANDYARYTTFQTPLEADSIAAGISRGTQRQPALKLLLPFVRTPVNLLKFAAERSPLATLMRSWRKEYMAGGARRDLAVARVLVGTGLGATIYQMAMAGQVTGGGPADREAKRLLQADGWQPYSLKIGDRYYSYARLDPFSTTIGTVADLVDLQSHMTDKQRDNSLTLVMAAVANNLSNKTWLSGISSALEAVNDPDRYLDGFLSRTAGAIAVPSVIAQAAKANDTFIREARGPVDRIRSRIPGLSYDLPAMRDAFGRPVRVEEGLGPDMVSPLRVGTARNDPTIAALIEAGIHVPRPPRTHTVDGKRVEWTPRQFERLQEVGGGEAKRGLDALVASPGWRRMGDDAREDAARKVIRSARSTARKEVLSPGLSALISAGAPARPAADAWAGFEEVR